MTNSLTNSSAANSQERNAEDKRDGSAQQRSVAVAVLLSRPAPDADVLICQRLPTARYALKWEFPGGKVEEGETPTQGVHRELEEELGIRDAVVHEVYREQSEYADGGRFDVGYFLCTSWSNELHNNAFNDLRWVSAQSVHDYDILEGNRAFCAILPEIIEAFFALESKPTPRHTSHRSEA